MIMRYWEVDERALAKLNDPHSSMRAGTLEQLTADVAHGVPVMVFPALTPFAHPISSDAAREIARGRFVALAHAPTGPHTEALGPMISLDLLAIYRDSLRAGTIAEAMVGAARVVIGYDDARHVVILNDPSFGPAYDLAEADFDRMWAVAGRRYSRGASRPPRLGLRAPRRRSGVSRAFRRRARRRSVRVRLRPGGDRTGRRGRGPLPSRPRDRGARPGLPPSDAVRARDPAHRAQANRRSDRDDACRDRGGAAEPAGLGVLSDLYLESFVPNHQRLAADAGRHAAELAEDERAKQDLARMLPQRFLDPVPLAGARLGITLIAAPRRPMHRREHSPPARRAVRGPASPARRPRSAACA